MGGDGRVDMVNRALLLVVGLIVLCVAVASAPATAASRLPHPMAVSAPNACGGSVHRRPVIRRVIVVVMENHSFSQIIGHAPFTTALARKCGLATNYFGVGHPSLPNYLAMTSGRFGGVQTDCQPNECPQAGPNIFSQLSGRGVQWRAYDESMPSACDTQSSGLYKASHNPAVYYTRVRSDNCRGHVLPLGSLRSGQLHLALNSGHAPAYMFVTPNICNDMHNCTVSVGDSWLQQWIPMITSSRAYHHGHTTILLTWDEGSNGDNQVPLIVVSPYTRPGTTSTRALTHYSLLRASEHLLGISHYLGNANSATGVSKAFHL
jgi:phospholipase C